ncbi:hypothetical protein N9937_01795, partial [bacterium]|nr:hypothetical protein [bacterium]
GDEIFNDKKAQQDLRRFNFFRNIELKNDALIRITPWRDSKNGLFRAGKSFLNGTEFGRFGARDSVQGAQFANETNMLGKYLQEMEDSDVLDLINGEDHQVEFHSALMGDFVEDERIRRAAEISKKALDDADRRQKRNGVYTKQLDRRGVRHFWSHKELVKTSDNIIENTNDKRLSELDRFEKSSNRFINDHFKAKNDTLLDLDETKNGFGVPLKNLSDLEIKTFIKNGFASLTNNKKYSDVGLPMSSKTGISRTADHRIFHFKDSESYVWSNAKYGVETVGTAVKREIQSASHNIAILEKLGNRPKALFNSILNQAEKDNPEFKLLFNKGEKRHKLNNLLDEVMGTFNDSSASLARLGSNVRSFINITSLESVFLRSLTDLAPISLENARMLGSWSDGMVRALKNVMSKETRARNKKIAKLTTVWKHNDIGSAMRVFSSGDQPNNVMMKLQRIQWKLSIMKWWDDGHRSGISSLAAENLAAHSDISFDQLGKTQSGKETRISMNQYGVDGDMWDLMRSLPQTLVDGTKVITQDSVRNADEGVFKEYLKKKGVGRISQTAIQDVKDKVEQKMALYFVDRTNHGIVHADAADRQMWFRGTSAGELNGFILRLISQYKMYATGFVTKPIASTLYRNGADTFKQAILEGKGDIRALAKLTAYATSLGYMGNVAASIANNETPDSPFSERGALQAFISGGMGGPYTDFVLNDPNKFGGGLIDKFVGPSLSRGQQAAAAFLGMFHGSTNKAQIVKLLAGNPPLLKTFYTKWAYDYLIYHPLQEEINPGYYAHKLAQLRQNHQSPLF